MAKIKIRDELDNIKEEVKLFKDSHVIKTNI